MRLDMLKPSAPNGIKLPYKIPMSIIYWWTGFWPGPPVVLLTRPHLLTSDFKRYFFRAISAKGEWSKGEVELFSAFVSKLNTCHF